MDLVPVANEKIIDRFENFDKALFKLDEISENREFTDLEKTGLILRFVFTLEISWKLLQDVLENEGNFDFKGVRGCGTNCLAKRSDSKW